MDAQQRHDLALTLQAVAMLNPNSELLNAVKNFQDPYLLNFAVATVLTKHENFVFEQETLVNALKEMQYSKPSEASQRILKRLIQNYPEAVTTLDPKILTQKTPLMQAVIDKASSDKIESLLQRDADPWDADPYWFKMEIRDDQQRHYRDNALCIAIRQNDLKSVQLFLEYAPPHPINLIHLQAGFNLAVGMGHIEIVKFLLNQTLRDDKQPDIKWYAIDVNQKNERQDTALVVAAWFNHSELLPLLIHAVRPLPLQVKHAVYAAIRENGFQSLEYLLTYAKRSDDQEGTKLLSTLLEVPQDLQELHRLAKMHALDKDDQTRLQDNTKIAKQLQEIGVPIESKDKAPQSKETLFNTPSTLWSQDEEVFPKTPSVSPNL